MGQYARSATVAAVAEGSADRVKFGVGSASVCAARDANQGARRTRPSFASAARFELTCRRHSARWRHRERQLMRGPVVLCHLSPTGWIRHRARTQRRGQCCSANYWPRLHQLERRMGAITAATGFSACCTEGSLRTLQRRHVQLQSVAARHLFASRRRGAMAAVIQPRHERLLLAPLSEAAGSGRPPAACHYLSSAELRALCRCRLTGSRP